MKNKKVLTSVIVIVLSVLVLSATAVAAVSSTSGYDAYKAALKNTIAAKSLTAQINVTAKDNGSEILNANSTVKENKDNKAMSSLITVVSGSQKKTAENYQQDGKSISKDSDSDVYNVFQFNVNKKHADRKWKKGDVNSARSKDVENVIDALAGNFQNYISMTSNNDNTKTVSFEMSGNQVSPVINAVASLAVKNVDRNEQGTESGRHKGDFGPKGGMNVFENLIKDKVPQLVSDVKVEKVDVQAKISSDNFIASQTVTITLSGKDANGQVHQVVVSANIGLSNINNTTPDKVDLTNKKVNNIQPRAEFKGQE